MLFVLELQLNSVFFQLEPSRFFEILILSNKTTIATLPYHAYFSRSEEAAAMLAQAFLFSTLTFMGDLALRLPIEVLLLNIRIIFIINNIQE